MAFNELTSGQELAIKLTSTATSVLSIIGAVFLLLAYALLPEYRSTPRRMLTVLSLVDLCICLSSLILLWQTPYSDVACRLYTYTSCYFNPCSFLWTMCTSYCVFKEITTQHWRLTTKLESIFNIFCWG